MKIAIFSDIHANLPALQAFFEHVKTREPDAIYCLGDLVGYNVWPNEAIAEIRKRSIACIAGNHDLKVPDYPYVENHTNIPTGKAYGYHIIDPLHRDYLQTLPAHLSLQFSLNNSTLNIFLAHGSPRSVDEYTLVDTSGEYVLEMMKEVGADILLIGHSHKPYHRVLKAANRQYKHIINTGSVGKPKDGDVRGGYVILDLDQNTLPLTETSLKVTFERFDYDFDTSARAIEESPLPNELADRLRRAD